MSAALVLPFVQARAEFIPILKLIEAAQAPAIERQPESGPNPRPQLAFYRKYTEAILRRYMRMSMQLGKVPCLLSRGEMFRAKVSNYRMESFEDVVIFCHDVERCIQRLTATQQRLIDLIAVKEYTAQEAAPILCRCRENIPRDYTRALDRLTGIFLDTQILKLSDCCQAPRPVQNAPTECN